MRVQQRDWCQLLSGIFFLLLFCVIIIPLNESPFSGHKKTGMKQNGLTVPPTKVAPYTPKIW